jgi:hypothetical protein
MQRSRASRIGVPKPEPELGNEAGKAKEESASAADGWLVVYPEHQAATRKMNR